MIKAFFSQFMPSYPTVLVYMLQSTEYQAKPYLAWYWRTNNFKTVMHRRSLDTTKAARSLLLAVRLGILLQIAVGVVMIWLGASGHFVGGIAFGIGVILAYPLVGAQALVVPLVLGRIFISRPAEQKLIEQSKTIFARHPGIKIAVAGSYGKTTMKELLATVLAEGKNVAATPANKNVSISHAYFARKLTGDEDILILEYGEGAPDDVERFAAITQPTHAIITGLAPAHLDHYKTLAAAGQDIFSVAKHVPTGQAYVNTESSSVEPFMQKGYQAFDTKGALGWKFKDIELGLSGTSFVLSKGKKLIPLHTKLIGNHNVGFVGFVAALALELGLTAKQVQAGVAKTAPFEHRMQAYPLGGAWVIDDTYNGNLEGIRAGTRLLYDLKAQRKIYVSPGLVEQGEETARVHTEMGALIAKAGPDIVVLMQNSTTKYIEKGLRNKNYSGEIRIESDPLDFYTNLKHFVATGDLVLMQNDWTDNYA